MSVLVQIITTFALELLAVWCCVGLLTHKDADGVMRSCGLFGIIGISLVIIVEIGLSIAYAVNPW